MHRSEDLVMEIVKNNQALFEDLGTVRATFGDQPQLRNLVASLSALHALKTPPPPTAADTNAIERWRDELVRQVQQLAASDYGKRFDDLLGYRFQQLNSAQRQR
jgi:hypothetical protein